MVALAAGDFLMGSVDSRAYRDDGEGPIRRVRLGALSIDPYAVSNAEFARFVAATEWWLVPLSCLVLPPLPRGRAQLARAGLDHWQHGLSLRARRLTAQAFSIRSSRGAGTPARTASS